nr:alpha/beta hydrolase fold carboxyl esterase [uncultured bacterium]
MTMHHTTISLLIGLSLLGSMMGCLHHDSTPEPPVQTRDVVYSSSEHLTCDVYCPPPTSTPAGLHPAVITVHGGAWKGGDKKDHARIAELLADRGYVVFCINYRLAPAYHFPAPVEDIQCAVVWVRTHAQQYGVNPDAIALLGTSAGAHLAVLAGLTASSAALSSVPPAPWDISCGSSTDSRVQAVISCFGPLDLSYHNGENAGTARVVAAFLGAPCQKAPALCTAANPMTYVSSAAPPMLLIHGTLDEVVGYEASERFYHALLEAGGEVILLPIEANHGFILAVSSPEAAAAMEAVCAFLDDLFS